ncbi:MAG: FtsQ-type POTRA domain-containing protein [Oscillospiraceae bacterium]|nr:FtsQ-type POTRA domain-containing protein [Oscillospiraceae bacterium]
MAVRRQKKRTIPVMPVLILALIVLGVLCVTVFFKIDTVKLTGSSNYTPEELVDASGIKAGANLIVTNMGAAEKNIEKLVYVEDATVKRSFPSSVSINVTASTPVANFICDRNVLLVSQGGKVLESSEEPKADLLDFYGTQPAPGIVPGDKYTSGDPRKDEAVNAVITCFTEEGYTAGDGITSIDVTDRTQISFMYQDRIKVEIGNINDLSAKMRFAMEILENRLEDRREGVLTLIGGAARASFMDSDSIKKADALYESNLEVYESKKAEEAAQAEAEAAARAEAEGRRKEETTVSGEEEEETEETSPPEETEEEETETHIVMYE